MDKKKLAKDIVELLGGKDNIANCVHCVTRLRFNLIDDSKANKKEIEELDGVMGLAEQGGQFQVIIGTSVADVFNEVEPLLSDKAAGAVPETKKKYNLMSILDVLTSIIAPIIPAFCAAGMIKIILLLLTALKISDGTEGAYQVFSIISDVAFYFLPILIAMSAAKRFKTDPGLAVCVAGALLYPTFVSMVSGGESLTFLGIHVPMYSYSSTIFPALLGVLLLSYLHRFWDRVVKWNAFKLLLVPILSLGITIPVTLLVLAPLGNWGALILGKGFSWMIGTLGPFAGLIIGFFMPIMTLTGLHQSLAPIELLELTSGGFSRILPIEFFHNMAESGAAFGTGVATKDKKFKALAFQTGTTAFMGVSEPALYTVMVKDRYAMLSAMIGNGIGGFLSILFALKMYAYVWPNVFSIPTFLGGDSITSNVVMLLASIVITFAVAFALPIVFSVLGLRKDRDIGVMSPISGKVIPLSEVKDEVFSKGICGEGVAVIPNEGRVVAPCDGQVVAAMNHAVGIIAKNGSEILIHVGLNTVELNGEGIKVFVKEGDNVKRGQLLIEFDKDIIEEKGYDTTCIVVKTNGEVKVDNDKRDTLSGEKLFLC